MASKENNCVALSKWRNQVSVHEYSVTFPSIQMFEKRKKLGFRLFHGKESYYEEWISTLLASNKYRLAQLFCFFL